MDDIDFASYADDNTPYTIGNDMEDVKLQNSSKIIFQWFMDNQWNLTQTNVTLSIVLMIQVTWLLRIKL